MNKKFLKLLTSKLVNKFSSTHVRESHFDSKRSYLAHGFPASQTLFFQVSLMITGLNWAHSYDNCGISCTPIQQSA